MRYAGADRRSEITALIKVTARPVAPSLLSRRHTVNAALRRGEGARRSPGARAALTLAPSSALLYALLLSAPLPALASAALLPLPPACASPSGLPRCGREQGAVDERVIEMEALMKAKADAAVAKANPSADNMAATAASSAADVTKAFERAAERAKRVGVEEAAKQIELDLKRAERAKTQDAIEARIAEVAKSKAGGAGGEMDDDDDPRGPRPKLPEPTDGDEDDEDGSDGGDGKEPPVAV